MIALRICTAVLSAGMRDNNVTCNGGLPLGEQLPFACKGLSADPERTAVRLVRHTARPAQPPRLFQLLERDPLCCSAFASGCTPEHVDTNLLPTDRVIEGQARHPTTRAAEQQRQDHVRMVGAAGDRCIRSRCVTTRSDDTTEWERFVAPGRRAAAWHLTLTRCQSTRSCWCPTTICLERGRHGASGSAGEAELAA
jgi:hypothetical protein